MQRLARSTHVVGTTGLPAAFGMHARARSGPVIACNPVFPPVRSRYGALWMVFKTTACTPYLPLGPPGPWRQESGCTAPFTHMQSRVDAPWRGNRQRA